MKDEALKLALEALEAATRYGAGGFEDAKDALREAQAAQQEPVAVARVDDLERGGRVRALAMGLALDASLYTSRPEPQRQWVGLTDEQIDLFINGRGDEDDDDYVEPTGDGFGLTDADLVKLVRRAEAKLRSQNT